MVTRVLLVDDHAVVRAGLRRLLEEHFEVVGEAGDADRAVELARVQRPDVIVLDVLLGSTGGIAAIPALREAAPKSRILMLSSLSAPETVREALDAGADGYTLKRAGDEDLIAAIGRVARGERYVHRELAVTRGGPLSPRERDVLRLIALGHTNREIAERLFISTRTTEMHRASIMRKLGLDTRAQLVSYALSSGLIS